MHKGLSRLEIFGWVTQWILATLTFNLRLGKVGASESAVILAKVVVKPSLRNCLPRIQERFRLNMSYADAGRLS